MRLQMQSLLSLQYDRVLIREELTEENMQFVLGKEACLQVC